MPVHRGERWIGAALQSVADQGEPGIEVLVIDSSPDQATAEVVKRYIGLLDIRWIDPGTAGNWHAKTNVAAGAARAEHLCWLHHDDLWLLGRAAAIRSWIACAPEAVLHLAPSAIIDSAGTRRGVWRCPFRAEAEVAPDDLLERLLVQNFVAAPAPVYRRDAHLACGGLDESLWYTADWDFWLKLAALGPVRHHPAITTAFRVHGASLTVSGSRNAGEFRRQMQTVVDRHLPRLGARGGAVARACRASIGVNSAFAAASGGNLRGLLPAAARLLALGPHGFGRYLRNSRIWERTAPRVRARMAGTL